MYISNIVEEIVPIVTPEMNIPTIEILCVQSGIPTEQRCFYLERKIIQSAVAAPPSTTRIFNIPDIPSVQFSTSDIDADEWCYAPSVGVYEDPEDTEIQSPEIIDKQSNSTNTEFENPSTNDPIERATANPLVSDNLIEVPPSLPEELEANNVATTEPSPIAVSGTTQTEMAVYLSLIAKEKPSPTPTDTSADGKPFPKPMVTGAEETRSPTPTATEEEMRESNDRSEELPSIRETTIYGNTNEAEVAFRNTLDGVVHGVEDGVDCFAHPKLIGNDDEALAAELQTNESVVENAVEEEKARKEQTNWEKAYPSIPYDSKTFHHLLILAYRAGLAPNLSLHLQQKWMIKFPGKEIPSKQKVYYLNNPETSESVVEKAVQEEKTRKEQTNWEKAYPSIPYDSKTFHHLLILAYRTGLAPNLSLHLQQKWMIKFPGEKIPSKQKVYYLNNHSLEVGDSPKGDVVHVLNKTTTIESQQYSSHCNTARLSTNVSPNKTICLSKKTIIFEKMHSVWSC